MTSFSQRDPRWSRNTLGTSALTIGEAGCLITALATILVDWGVNTDPGRLNRWLRDNAGYQDGARLRFYAPAGLGADLVEIIACRYTPAPAATLLDYIALGYAVLIEVNARPGKPHASHWTRLTETGQVMDPWQPPGNEVVPLARYALPGWDVTRTITAAVVYQHNTARVIPFTIASSGPTSNPPAIYTEDPCQPTHQLQL